MHQLIHVVLRFPLLILLALLSLSLVIGILLSDWAEMKRRRKLRKLIEQSRLHREGNESLPVSNPAGIAGVAAERGIDHFTSKFLRSRLIWPGIACLAAAMFLLEMRTPARSARARTVRDTATEASGSGDTNVGVRGGQDSVATRLFTNDMAQSSEVPASEANQAHRLRETTWGSSPARITISAPKTALVDPGLPSAIDWNAVKSIHPDPAEIPQPPSPPPRPLR